MNLVSLRLVRMLEPVACLSRSSLPRIQSLEPVSRLNIVSSWNLFWVVLSVVNVIDRLQFRISYSTNVLCESESIMSIFCIMYERIDLCERI